MGLAVMLGVNQSLIGILVLGLGLLFMLLGDLAALYVVVQYGFLLSLLGIVLAFTGWKAFKLLIAPLAVLLFMIPLPNFLYQGLSAELQLISSQIGVAVIRLFGVSVYLEGNVIDLGTYKLQVVEACSGLRYLFPLTSLAFIAAYLFRYTKEPIGVVMGLPTLQELFEEKYYSKLEGGILESFGRMFKNDLRLYVYPSQGQNGSVSAVENLQVQEHLQGLYEYLVGNRFIRPIDDYNEDYLSISLLHVMNVPNYNHQQ